MMRSTAKGAAWLLAATLCIPASAQDAKTIEREGDCFKVVFHPGDLEGDLANAMVDAALAKAEELWPVVSKLVGARRPGRAHEIQLYRSEPDYRAAEKASSPWGFPLEAFVDAERVGHVWMTPGLDPRLLAHVGLPQSAVEDLLRVAAEQVVAPAVRDSEISDWTKWLLVMGAVESLTNPSHAPGYDWAHDARRHLLIELVQRDGDITFGRLVDWSDGQADRRSWNWLLARSALISQTMAAANRGWGRKLLRRHRLPRGQTGAEALRRVAAKAVIDRSWHKVEQEFEQVRAGVAPPWVTVRPLWQPSSERALLAGTQDLPAVVDSGFDRLPDGDYVFSGRLELGQKAETKLNDVRVCYGWDQKTQVVVAFADGLVWIGIWDQSADRYRDRQRIEHPIQRGVPFTFRIEVRSRAVRLDIDGQRVAEYEYDDRETHNAISIQVNDRIVWFEDLRIEALET